MNLSRVAALSGVAPSTRLTLLAPGMFGSARRFRMSVRAWGTGSGAVGAAVTTIGLDAGGTAEDVADAGTRGSLCEHPDRPTATTAVSAADRSRRIRRSAGRCGDLRFGLAMISGGRGANGCNGSHIRKHSVDDRDCCYACGEGFCGHRVSFRWSQIDAEVTSGSKDATFDGF
jgi:hypothetical protein